MPFWGLPMPPLWFWLLVMGLIMIHIYLLKVMLEEEESYVPPSVEERLNWEITKMKSLEIIAWIFLALGVIIYAYGTLDLSPLIMSVAGCLVVGSYLAATYFRKRRFERKEELEEKLL